MPDAEHRLARVTARATAGGLRAISGGSRSTHRERDRSRFGGSVTFTLGTAAEDRPKRNGSFLRRSMTRKLPRLVSLCRCSHEVARQSRLLEASEDRFGC